MTVSYDTAIIGAGPAGSLAAYYLSRAGAKCVLIEKEKGLRYKPCGGGITLRAFKCLPFSIDEVVEDETVQPVIFLKNTPIYENIYHQPVIRMVMRDRFDRFLAEKAAGEGTDILDGSRFKSISGKPGDLTISTSRGPVRAKIILGADGALGRTAGALGFPHPRKYIFALEAEMKVDGTQLDRFRGKACFDLSAVPSGYGWIFPKADHLSVGVGTDDCRIKHLKPHLIRYLRLSGLNPEAGLETVRPHLIPYAPGRKSVLADQRGMLIGDASGFADPVTGEGLYSAFRQAKIAADLALEALRFGYVRLLQFDCLNHQALGSDFRFARFFGWLLYHHPGLRHWVITRKSREAAGHLMGVFAGDTSYRALLNRFLKGAWLWRLAKRRLGGGR